MILSGQILIDNVRDHCKKAKRRIWIASPFIGSLNEVYKIIDGVWKKPSVDFKVITDAEAGFIRKDTLDEFNSAPRTEIRSLNSLHAKIYIIDDWCLITSANLTSAAFCMRYEIGTETDIKPVEKQFNDWWNIAVPISTLHRVNYGTSGDLANYQNGRGMHFTKKCNLPAYNTTHTDKFMADCEQFKEFAKLYEKVTGRNKQMKNIKFPLYLEVDYFFNFLYNDAVNTPSKNYKDKKARILTDAQRQKEILMYFKQMPYDQARITDRFNRISTVQSLLSPSKISTLTKNEVRDVLGCFHCLYSQPINKTKIVNNNTISKIRSEWNRLLNSGKIITSQDVADAVINIKYFGYSCVSELIAWYMPNDYPIMNLNSKSGMRFFGIEIK